MARDRRLALLVDRLRDGRLHTAADLARAFGVTPRTIWRDMATLASGGLPVEGERGIGYVLRAPVILPPMVLTGPELLALRAGLAAVMAAGDAGLARGARTLGAKIAAVTPLVARAGDHRLADDPLAEDPLADDPAPQRHLPLIRRAIRARAWLTATCVTPEGAETTLTLRPIALALDDRLRILKAQVRGEDAPRALRVDRILALADAPALPDRNG